MFHLQVSGVEEAHAVQAVQFRQHPAFLPGLGVNEAATVPPIATIHTGQIADRRQEIDHRQRAIRQLPVGQWQVRQQRHAHDVLMNQVPVRHEFRIKAFAVIAEEKDRPLLQVDLLQNLRYAELLHLHRSGIVVAQGFFLAARAHQFLQARLQVNATETISAVRIPEVQEAQLLRVIAGVEHIQDRLQRTETLIASSRIHGTDTFFVVEETEHVGALGMAADCKALLLQQMHQVGHAVKHLQVGLPEETVLKGVESREQGRVGWPCRRRRDEEAVCQCVVACEYVKFRCFESRVGTAQRVVTQAIDGDQQEFPDRHKRPFSVDQAGVVLTVCVSVPAIG